MSLKFPRVDCRQLIRALKRAGFEEQRQRGSHLHLRRASNGKRVTVPVHKGRTVPIGTLRAILRDADISVDEFKKAWLFRISRGQGKKFATNFTN